MSWIERLTPKDTEEVKPGLFIKKTRFSYRQVHPAAWDGKINWKNLTVGPNFWKNFLWFAILVFIVLGYMNDVREYKGWYERYTKNPAEFCKINFYEPSPSIIPTEINFSSIINGSTKNIQIDS